MRAYHGGRFDFDLDIDIDKSARVLAVVLILVTSLTAVPPGAVDASRAGFKEQKAEKEDGSVAGASEKDQSPVEPEWPRKKEGTPDLGELTAEAVLAVDGENKKVLLEKNSRKTTPPASLTKVMTALVALEKYPLDKEFVVSEACLLGLEGKAHMNLQPGERIITKNLLYGLLMHSAADAACVLARNPESTYDDSRANEEEFISAMNRKAQELGMENTHFVNTVGLDAEKHYSTAEDLLRLVREAMQNRVFQIIVATREINVHDAGNPPSRWHGLESTNDLLFDVPYVTGVKTGTTENAGECLAVSWLWEGRELYAVLLGSAQDQRFEEMKRIIEWVKSAYDVQAGPAGNN